MQMTCSSCTYWIKNPHVRVAANPMSPGGGRDVAVDVCAGNCVVNPPVMELMPVQSLQGQGIVPQPLDPLTLENRRACRYFELREKAEVSPIKGIT